MYAFGSKDSERDFDCLMKDEKAQMKTENNNGSIVLDHIVTVLYEKTIPAI